MPEYHFVIASQKFLLHEEPVEEILRERTNYYKRINKDIDFWLVKNPNFISMPEFKHLKVQLNNPTAAIISLDQKFIQWLKLRIGFVAIGNFASTSYNML